MKLFVYEHITSGALINEELPASLAHEGMLMLATILKDCQSLPDIETLTLCDNRLTNNEQFNGLQHQFSHIINSDQHYKQAWQQCLNQADLVLIIAPETDGILAQLQQHALLVTPHVLGCSPQTIELTSNKLICNQLLGENQLIVAQTCLASDWQAKHFASTNGYIVKPIDGAGCIDTLFFDSECQLNQYLSAHSETYHRKIIIQRYIEGEHASLTVLYDRNSCEILAFNQQIIERSKQLQFKGCIINGDIGNKVFTLEQAASLALQVQHVFPDLSGFVGIDIILVDNHAVIVDINPRITTSYVGLAESLAINPLQRLLQIKDKPLAKLAPISQRKKVEITL